MHNHIQYRTVLGEYEGDHGLLLPNPSIYASGIVRIIVFASESYVDSSKTEILGAGCCGITMPDERNVRGSGTISDFCIQGFPEQYARSAYFLFRCPDVYCIDMEPHTHVRIHGTALADGTKLAHYLPLIGIVGLVLLLTAASWLFFSLPLMQGFMTWFFLVFGGLKAARLSGFVEAYRMYDLIAMRSVTYAYAYPFLELAAGVAYLVAWQLPVVNLLVIIVMLIGAVGVYRKLRAGETVPCACLGTVFTIPMTWVTLGEDLLMAGMATFMLLSASGAI